MTENSFSFSKHLDWVAATWEMRDEPFTVLPPGEQFKAVAAESGTKHYRNAWRLKCGGLFGWGKEERQGVLVILPGEALRNLRESGFGDQQTVDWLKGARNVTRLDYALDVVGGEQKTNAALLSYNAWKDGAIKTRLKLNLSYKDETWEFGGESFYFGSKSSDQRVIVYDKAAEQKMKGIFWTRYEFRFKDDYAKALVWDMSEKGIYEAGDQKVRNIWDADIESFQAMLNEEKVILRDCPRPEPAWKKWLWATVLRSIEQNVKEHRNTIVDFYNEVGRIIREYDKREREPLMRDRRNQ